LNPAKPMNSPVWAISSAHSPYPSWSNLVSMRSISASLAARLGEEPHRLRVSVENRERRAAGREPTLHEQPVRADGVEPGGLGHHRVLLKRRTSLAQDESARELRQCDGRLARDPEVSRGPHHITTV
jgi:hypothetical protein